MAIHLIKYCSRRSQESNISIEDTQLKTHQWIDVNTLRPRQHGRHFPDDVFKCIFLNENIWIPIKISSKFVPEGSISNIPALVQIMAWRRPGVKPLSESMMVGLPTHICVTRPQWVKYAKYLSVNQSNECGIQTQENIHTKSSPAHCV